MKQKPEFLLSKWYLDCIAENGDTFIGYHATVRWKTLSIHYSSIITHFEDSGTRTHFSLKKSQAPRMNDSSVIWNSELLKVKGTWNSTARPIQRQLYETEEGNLTWSCMMPRAEAEISLGDSRYVPGVGYVEHLSLTLKPWELPIRELRWGRFHSEKNTLVWIDWKGPHPQCLVYHNGILKDDCSINDRLVTLKNGECSLLIDQRKVLRSGNIISPALSSIPGVAKLVPESILQAGGNKWRSKGFLSHENSLPEEGWVIHENVKFAWGVDR